MEVPLCVPDLAKLQRWAENHQKQLEKFLQFNKPKQNVNYKRKTLQNPRAVPHAITFARVLRQLSLERARNIEPLREK